MKARGLSENTLKIVSYRLKVLSKHCDLDNPEQVNTFIANLRASNSYKSARIGKIIFTVSEPWNGVPSSSLSGISDY